MACSTYGDPIRMTPCLASGCERQASATNSLDRSSLPTMYALGGTTRLTLQSEHVNETSMYTNLTEQGLVNVLMWRYTCTKSPMRRVTITDLTGTDTVMALVAVAVVVAVRSVATDTVISWWSVVSCVHHRVVSLRQVRLAMKTSRESIMNAAKSNGHIMSGNVTECDGIYLKVRVSVFISFLESMRR